MTTLWRVNGRATGVDPADRGLAYGDGLFETMAARDGSVRYLGYHLERLLEGCRRLAIPEPDRDEIEREIDEHCPRVGRAIVKLIVTRGPGERGYAPPDDSRPTRIVSVAPWRPQPQRHYTDGIRVHVCSLRLGESPALAGLKHLCRLEQVLAQLELRGTGAQQGLLLDGAGRVVGGTNTNVFAVRAGALVTPTLSRCGVRGVMRRAVLERAAALGLECAERDLTLEDLAKADELFVTNALIGIWPVAEIDGRAYGPGGTTRRLMTDMGFGVDA